MRLAGKRIRYSGLTNGEGIELSGMEQPTERQFTIALSIYGTRLSLQRFIGRH